MPNTTVPAAGAAMLQSRSLTATIDQFRYEWDLYLTLCLEAERRGEIDSVPKNYEPAMQILEAWDQPAEDLAEATMALQLAAEDYQAGDTPRIPAMMNAALGFMLGAQNKNHHSAAARGAPSLYRLLAIYWDQYDNAVQASRRTDATVAGTKERADAGAAQSAADDLLEEACLDICAFRPDWIVDARIKASFVALLAQNNFGGLSESEISALLTSLPFLFSTRDRDDQPKLVGRQQS